MNISFFPKIYDVYLYFKLFFIPCFTNFNTLHLIFFVITDLNVYICETGVNFRF